MSSDGKNVSDLAKASNLNEDERKDLAKKAARKEVDSLLSAEAKWTQSPTAFDHLPPHEKPFSIEPFPNARQRLPFKMTEEDRLRRKLWVQSQELTDREPVRVPELERMIYNPIRRLYRLPTDRLFQALAPVVGEHRVKMVRTIVPKLLLGWLTGCVLWYNFKYNKENWEEKKGFTLLTRGGVFLPEDQKPATKQKWDYADRGFQSRKAFKDSQYAY